MYSAEEAKQKGCIFYELPSNLTPEMVDPLIRKAVFRINESGWVWTAESCAGHPEATIPSWAGNTRPMLRLVTPEERLGDMFAALYEAVRLPLREDPEVLWLPESIVSFVVFRCPGTKLPYTETLIYCPHHECSVYERNLGLLAFEQFAELICARK